MNRFKLICRSKVSTNSKVSDRLLLVGSFAMLSFASPADAQSRVFFDAYHLGLADTWKPPFATYTYVRAQESATNEEKYVFTAAEFNKLKKLTASDCKAAPCSIRVVKQLATDQDVKDVRKMLLPGGGDPAILMVVGNIAGLFNPEIGAGMFLLDLVNKAVTSDKVSLDKGTLGTLLAKGGEVVYEERLPGVMSNGRFWITRSVYYRVMLGSETREVPLHVIRLPAEIK